MEEMILKNVESVSVKNIQHQDSKGSWLFLKIICNKIPRYYTLFGTNADKPLEIEEG